MLARTAAKRCALNLSRRHTSSLPPLPPPDEWKAAFPSLFNTSRYFLKDQPTADRLAKAFIVNKGVSQEPKIIIEAFPGPGVLSRGLLKLPPSQVKRLIILEDVEHYLKYLKPLEECDPRVTVIPQSGFHWSSYRELDAVGQLSDVVSRKWDDAPPNLHFVSHISNSVHGDQLVSQFLRLMPEGNWLFKNGRVTLSLIIHKALFDRTIAGPLSKAYCKHSVIAGGVCEVEDLTPKGDPLKFAQRFFPLHKSHETRKGLQHTSGGPYCALNLYPLANPAIERATLDKWDYCLRRLFVLKSTPLHKAMSSLAPGASNLLPVIKQNVDVNKKVRELSLKDFGHIVKAFSDWPFAPEDLLITDALREVERER